MADITKCEGTGCIVKDICYRYTAPDGLRQSYFIEIPLTKSSVHDGKHCNYYIENEA